QEHTLEIVKCKRLFSQLFLLDSLMCYHVQQKTSRKGPRNLLSGDQSVIAKTMSENTPGKSFSRACRKSMAVRCGSFPKAPQPHPPRTSAACPYDLAIASTRCTRCRKRSPACG